MAEGALTGVVMELEDGAYGLLDGVVASIDPMVAFRDVDVCVLLGGFPRKAGMERKDLLAKNMYVCRALKHKTLSKYCF